MPRSGEDVLENGEGAGACEIQQTGIRENLTVMVKVMNRSDAAAEEVLQVYVKNLDSEYAAPNAGLCAFTRIFLPGKESKYVTLDIDKDSFTVINSEGERTTECRRFMVSVGFGQPDMRTRTLTGKDNITFTLHRTGKN